MKKDVKSEKAQAEHRTDKIVMYDSKKISSVFGINRNRAIAFLKKNGVYLRTLADRRK